MGLRNTVMGIGALGMLVCHQPLRDGQVLGILVLVVLPSLYFGRRVRKLSRASQDRVADSSAIAAEVLNAIPVVQSYTCRRAARPRALTRHRKRLRHRAQAHAGARHAGGLHHHRHLRRAAVGPVPGHAGGAGGDISAGHLGQTVVYVIILVGAWRCWARSTATCCAPPAPPSG
jgi:ATP-binding cassette subfamily B protein